VHPQVTVSGSERSAKGRPKSSTDPRPACDSIGPPTMEALAGPRRRNQAESDISATAL